MYIVYEDENIYLSPDFLFPKKNYPLYTGEPEICIKNVYINILVMHNAKIRKRIDHMCNTCRK